MHSYRSLHRNLRKNLRTIYAFEAIIKLVTIVFAIPLFSLIERTAMWLTGYRYLSAENLHSFFRNPIFLLFSLVFLFLVALYSLFDMTGVVYNLHMAYCSQKTDVFHTFLFAFRNTGCTVFVKRRIGVLPLLLLILPCLCLGLVPALAGNLLVKEVLLKKLRTSRLLLAVFLILVGMLLAFFLEFMYACQIMLLEDCDVFEAMKRSRELGKNRHGKDLFLFILTQASCYFIYALLLGIAMLAAILLERILLPLGLIGSVSTSLMLTVTNVSFCLFASWTMPTCVFFIGTVYYQHMLEKEKTIPGIHVVNCVSRSSFLYRFRKLRTAVSVLLISACVIVCGVYVYLTYKGRFNPHIEYVYQTEITAHRGASRYYPENTMVAFRGAMNQGADWIELDIHQSRDGFLFVMHDDTLRRTCGVKGYCWDYTWEELSRMDAGSFFSSDYKGERIPLLSEVLDFAIENNLRLNIELKPSVHEEGMEERLVRLLEEKDFIEQCVVTSQKYNTVSRVKKFNPQITTVYVMGYAYGSVDDLKGADHFSINMSSVSGRLVKRLHNAGRQIFVWTVNSRTLLEDMMDKNVDNIITNDVPLAKKIIGEKRTSGAFYEYVKLLHRLFSIG